ncbi:hypothetical protein VdG2_07348 [Verticillium dahliae VDG2]|nr:hypothetical protein VdG2_07348 [Verticillium dahliae VDG2]
MAHQPSVRPAVPPPSQAASNAAAALQGANLAFARTTASRPIPPAKRVLPNGALYAAATASIRAGSRSRSPAPYDTKSPSYIAATLAASRSASPSPNANTPVPCLPVARRRTSVNSLSGASSLDLPDTSSIAPTTNLISMFERREDEDNGNGDDVEPMKKRTPVRRPTAMRRVPQLRAMTPEREISPQGRRTPPVRDPGSLATEETTPTARAKPRVKPKLRPMTPERKMSPDRREPGSPLRSELTPPSNPNPHVKARPGLAETEARPRPVETQAGEEAAAKPRAPSPPKPMRAVMAPLRLTQRHAPETRPPQPQKGQRVPDVSLRLGAPETATKADRSNGQALAAKSKPPPSLPPTLPPTPSSPKPVLVPKTRKHRPESIEMPPPRIISRSATAVLSPVPTRPASQAKLRPPTPPQPRGASSTAKPAAPPRATAPLPVNDANLAALSNGRRLVQRDVRLGVLDPDTAASIAHTSSGAAAAALVHDQHACRLANKALHAFAPSPPPGGRLGEVWDLVVGQSAGALPPGMLGKQEFVVGTWVVDQRLKGRKIPAKVGASVWDSAKGVRVWTPKAKEARRK